MVLRKQLGWTVLLGAAALALVVLAVGMLGWAQPNVEAAHDPVTQATPGEDVGFDMIIDDNGDTVIDNTLNTLGPVDACAAVSPSGSITFDVFLDSIPSGANLSGYNYVIQPLPAQNLNGLGVSAVVNVGNGAASIILGNEGSGTAFSLGTNPPNPLAGFGIQDADLGTAEAPPTTVRGLMNRFTVSANAGPDGIPGNGDDAPAAVGLYPMQLTTVGVFNSAGGEILDIGDQQADTVDQDGDTLVDEDSLIDGFDLPGFGVIAVGDVNGDTVVNQSDCVGLVPNVIIASLDCNNDPEEVEIRNAGGATQDLTGWLLRSDPVGSETFDLSTVGFGPVADGMLDPGETVSIFSDSLAPISDDPTAGNFTWTTSEIYRDGDTSDFAEIVDAAGAPVDQVNCSLLPTPTPTPTPIPTPTPTRTPTPTPTRTPTPTPTATPAQLPTVGSAPPAGGSVPWALLAAGTALLALAAGGFGASRILRRQRG